MRLINHTDDTMAYFQNNVFSLELAHKIMFFKCYLQLERMVILFLKFNIFSILGIKTPTNILMELLM